MSDSLKSSSSNSIISSQHENVNQNILDDYNNCTNNDRCCASQSLSIPSAFVTETEVNSFLTALLSRLLPCSKKHKSNSTGDRKHSKKNWLCCGMKNYGCQSKQNLSTSSSSHCSNEYTPSPNCSYHKSDDQEISRIHSKTLPNSKCTKIILKKGVISTQTLPREVKYANASVSVGTTSSEGGNNNNQISHEILVTPPNKSNLVISRDQPILSTAEDVTTQSYQTPIQPSTTSNPSLTLPLYDRVRESVNATWSLSKELEKLSHYGWYWGPITRLEAEEKLTNQPDGTFLVRDSSDDRYLLSLSFRSYNRTLHTRIEHSNGMFSLYTQTESEGYRSIVELIEHSITDSQTGIFCYSRARTPGSLSFPVRLTKPVSRFAQVRSLQYLCRFLIRESIRLDHIRQLPLPSVMKDFLEERPY